MKSLKVLASILVVAGCGDQTPTGDPTAARTEIRTDAVRYWVQPAAVRSEFEPVSANAVLIRPEELQDAGSVKITVKWEGAKPKIRPYDVSGNDYCKGKNEGGKIKSERLVLNENGTVRWTYIRVSKGLENMKFETPASAVQVTQENCQYKPHMILCMVNQSVEFNNGDETTHNVKHVAKDNPEDSKNQEKKGAKDTMKFANEEIMGLMKCNVHDWMEAPICISRHPYHAATDEKGEATIEKLPPGKYTLEAHHENYGKQTVEVTIEKGKTAEVSFSFKKPE